MKKFLLQFIPEHYSHEDQNFRKAKLFVNICFITSLFSTFYFVSSSLVGMPKVQWAMAFNAVGFVLLPFVLRKDWLSLKFLANCYISIGGIGVLITVFNTGGLISSILPWLAVLPITSLMLIDKRSGWVWTILSYLAITLVGLLSIFGFKFNDEAQVSFLPLFNTANLNGLGVLIFLIALVFENTTNTALKNLADKNTLLDMEKKRSEDLLSNILPEEVIEELKQNGESRARLYTNVTVMFTDFVNFTGISETLTPGELVEEIHKNFTAFDAIMEKHGIEKIKTIGDAYLAVCGLPIEVADHAQRITKAALEIQAFMLTNSGKFQVRIGIHSGQVVAGIVGVKKFAYDIWGDTVNMANRMESNSEAGKINISQATYELLTGTERSGSAEFEFEYRGKINAKNKGEVDMWFVENVEIM